MSIRQLISQADGPDWMNEGRGQARDLEIPLVP
jgi:hypothetical protein